MGGKSSSKSSTATTAKTQNLNAQANTAPLSVPSVSIGSSKYANNKVQLNLDQSKKTTVLENVGNTTTLTDNSVKKATTTTNTTVNHSTTLTDHGAIAAAANSVDSSINLALKTSLSSLKYYDAINQRALDNIAGVAAAAIESTTETTEKALLFADEITRTDEAQNYDNLVKWGGAAMLALIILRTIKS